MTATQRTTDRSRSVTTAISPRRTQRHRSRDPITRMGCSIQAASALLRSRSPTAPKPPPKPRAPHRLPHNALAAARRLDPPPARSPSPLRLSLLLRSLLSPPPQSVICPTTALVHTRPSTLHQLLPVPGPDPARLPLWWLGGVRARHRPQPPIPTRIECGRAVHTPVRGEIRTTHR